MDNNTQNNIDSNQSNTNINRRRSSNRQRRSVTSREDSYNSKKDNFTDDNQNYEVSNHSLDAEIDTPDVENRDNSNLRHRGRARRSHVDSERQDNVDNVSHSSNRINNSNNYNDERYPESVKQYKKPNKTLNYVIYSAIVAVVAIGGFVGYKALHKPQTIVMAKVVAITPNYTTIQIPGQSCHNVVTSKQVKNPNRNFFNGMFASKSHPEYITQSSSKEVCETTYTESQVLQNYTMEYQIGNSVESTIVTNPPALNSVMPVSELQQYLESSVAVVANASAPLANGNEQQK